MENRFSSPTCCSSNWPLASRRGHTLIRTPQLISRHADRQTDRRWEMTPCPLKQVRWRLKIHARDAEWNPGDYAMQFWFSRIQTAPQATSSWRRRGYRFSRWSQGQTGFESVNLLQHSLRANRTSKMWIMWPRIISSFQRCTVLWEKSPLSVRKLCKNSCNGNYETLCIRNAFPSMPIASVTDFFTFKSIGQRTLKLARDQARRSCQAVGNKYQ